MPENENIPCIYAEHPSIITNLTEHEENTILPISIVTTGVETKILFKKDGFMIETHPDHGSANHSWVTHYCPSKHWKMSMDEAYMVTYGVCHHCYTEIPPGIIALWKLHNWDDIQQSGPAPLPRPTAYPPRAGAIASCDEWPSC
jgi:hypothetical protein